MRFRGDNGKRIGMKKGKNEKLIKILIKRWAKLDQFNHSLGKISGRT